MKISKNGFVYKTAKLGASGRSAPASNICPFFRQFLMGLLLSFAIFVCLIILLAFLFSMPYAIADILYTSIFGGEISEYSAAGINSIILITIVFIFFKFLIPTTKFFTELNNVRKLKAESKKSGLCFKIDFED